MNFNSLFHTGTSSYSTTNDLSLGKETAEFNHNPFEDVLVKEKLSSKFENRYAKLDKRSLIQVSGEDAELLLQGLTTNQMSLISNGGSGIQTAFLLSNGRVLADAFVYPVNKPSLFSHSDYLIETDDRIKDQVVRLLTMHKLRSKVDIKDVTNDYNIYSIWGNSIYTKILGKPDTTMSQNLPKGSLVYKLNEIMGADIWLKDNRCPSMGLRIILNSSQQPCFPKEFTEATSDDYRLFRILLGVPEGIDDFIPRVSFPLELNLDYTGGDKSFILQTSTEPTEIFATATNTLLNQPADLEHGASAGLVRKPRKRADGKLASSSYNFALALFKLETVNNLEKLIALKQDGQGKDFDKLVIKCNSGKDIYVLPKFPSWWP
ncbi:putative transferase CAF17, mitochondrial [Smittium culicis]|uniref:Putative transferase CAF17, mitochondrial n=1 Tax=Smittium culicis TaxID=133412 RepID=A0A1R1Y1I7_9FUNG|nr:putative transferase CAF17, mitochondrial [Smittium culicis]OMJ24735.1 putative transferase CAF17, mitochondrial [Smittium culicis]